MSCLAASRSTSNYLLTPIGDSLRDGPLEPSAIPVLPMGNVTIMPFDAEPFLMVGRLWESSSSS